MTKRKKLPTSSPDLFQTPTVAPVSPVNTITPPAALPVSARPVYSFDSDQIAVLQNLIEEAGQAEMLQAGPEGLEGTGVSRLEGPMVSRVTSSIIRRANGSTWADEATLGDPFAVIHGLACRSKSVLAVWRSGEAAFRLTLGADLEAKIAKRSSAPKKKYVIGRVGKDQDGVLMHPDTHELLEVEPDNGNLLKHALSCVHPDYKPADAGEKSVDKSKHVTYNIAFFRQDAPVITHHQTAPIDITPEAIEGGKQAERSPFG